VFHCTIKLKKKKKLWAGKNPSCLVHCCPGKSESWLQMLAQISRLVIVLAGLLLLNKGQLYFNEFSLGLYGRVYGGGFVLSKCRISCHIFSNNSGLYKMIHLDHKEMDLEARRTGL